MTMNSITCNLLVIRSTDLERAANFYRAIGLELVSHAHGTGPKHYAHENNEHTFEIYPLVEDAPPTHSTRIGFAVECVEQTFANALAAGAEVISPPKDSPWGRRAIISDPDGHKIELTSRSTRLS